MAKKKKSVAKKKILNYRIIILIILIGVIILAVLFYAFNQSSAKNFAKEGELGSTKPLPAPRGISCTDSEKVRFGTDYNVINFLKQGMVSFVYIESNDKPMVWGSVLDECLDPIRQGVSAYSVNVQVPIPDSGGASCSVSYSVLDMNIVSDNYCVRNDPVYGIFHDDVIKDCASIRGSNNKAMICDPGNGGLTGGKCIDNINPEPVCKKENGVVTVRGTGFDRSGRDRCCGNVLVEAYCDSLKQIAFTATDCAKTGKICESGACVVPAI